MRTLTKCNLKKLKLDKIVRFPHSFRSLEFLRSTPKSGAIPLLGKVGKFPTFVVF
jgi:hypothetical protein